MMKTDNTGSRQIDVPGWVDISGHAESGVWTQRLFVQFTR